MVHRDDELSDWPLSPRAADRGDGGASNDPGALV
jgi:hypothetical protein